MSDTARERELDDDEAILGADPVDFDSDSSFPASDPPAWSGVATVGHGVEGEAPPAGSQAGWSVGGPKSGAGERRDYDPPDTADEERQA